MCRDIAECRVGSSNTCDENDGYVCQGILSQTQGSAGICEDIAECRVGDSAKECEEGICVSDFHSREWGAAGTCHKETIGEECVDDEECIPGEVCEGAEGAKECVYGERGDGNEVLPTLSNFRIFVHNQFVVPLRANGATEDNPSAGWVGAIGAEMRILARGPDANTGLLVATPLGVLSNTCSHDTHCTPTDCEWVCTLPEGWAGEGPEAEVHVGLGAATQQVWTYHVSTLPALTFNMPQAGMVGESLEICLIGMGMDAPLHEVRATSIQVLDVDTPLSLSWTEGALEMEGTGHVGKKCWTAPLPLTLAWSNETLTLQVFAEVEDIVGDLTQASYHGGLVLTRTSCAAGFSGTVNAPLTFVNGHLVFAAGAFLHVFDADNCQLVDNTLQTGTVTGPMAALESGGGWSLAVATTGSGASGRTASRLLLIDMEAQPPDFSYDGDRDCVRGQAGIPSTAQFAKGLSLLSMEPVVRYVAAANESSNTVLVAYEPHEMNATSRCISTGVGATLLMTPAQADNGELLVGLESYPSNALSTMRFNGQSTQWENGNWTASGVSTGAFAGIALGNNESIWLSLNTSAPHTALLSWENGGTTPTSHATNFYRFFPAVIDSQGISYAVGYVPGVGTGITGYTLHRMSADNTEVASAKLPQGTTQLMVGSPILGEPVGGGPAEIYVVSGNGRVFAFNSDTMQQLWMLKLGGTDFKVSDTAQPVLVPHADGGGTLWVVGSRAEVYGIRVNSNGLSKTALWPKAFRDNCNTGSRLVTPGNLPGCF
jgi:outer membrane protein assembly factor BamB